MATYKDTALALPNLVALWMLTDADGTRTAVDSGPNNLPLTYNSDKVSGVENILGAGAGMLSSSTLYASRAVAAGSALAPTAAVTYAAWITPTAFTATTALMGRVNSFRMFSNPSGGFGSIASDGSNFDTRCGTYAALNTAYFVVVVYTGTYTRVYVNGVLLQESVRQGTLASTSDAIAVGSLSGTAFAGTISGAAVWSRGLNAAEIKELWLAGTKVTEAADGLIVDNLYDDTMPIIASAAAGVRCAICQGKRRVNEPVITNTTGAFFHPACYAAKGSGKTMSVPTAATPWADYEGPTLRLVQLVMHSLMKKVTNWSRQTYFDGSRIQNTGIALTGQYDVYFAWVLTAAQIARKTGMPPQHWMIKFFVNQMEHIWTLQDATTGGLSVDVEYAGGGGADFITGELGEALLYLKDYVPAATWTRWKTNFLKMIDYDSLYPTGGPEINYYVNGNREAGSLWGYYLAYLVSGKDAKYQTLYEQQYTFLTTLETKLHSGNDSAGSHYFGFITVVEPTFADGRDGKGYLIERTGSKVGHVLNSATGAVLDGYDPNYVSLSTFFLIRLYLHSNDIRILRMINMQFNMSMERVNVVPGSVISTTLAAPAAIGDTTVQLAAKPALVQGYFNVGTGTALELLGIANVTGSAAPYTATVTPGKSVTKAHASGETVVRDSGPFILDGRDGSRQDNTQTFGFVAFPFLANVMGRTDITPTMVAAAFAEMVRYGSTDMLNATGLARDLNHNIATWLMCLPSWPADPLM